MLAVQSKIQQNKTKKKKTHENRVSFHFTSIRQDSIYFYIFLALLNIQISKNTKKKRKKNNSLKNIVVSIEIKKEYYIFYACVYVKYLFFKTQYTR
jgi:hypothetical protein